MQGLSARVDPISWREGKIPMPNSNPEAKLLDALNVQVGGNHYKKYKIQPIEYAMANDLNYCQANAVKYTTRYRDKGGVEDLRKAIHNLEILIELESRDRPE